MRRPISASVIIVSHGRPRDLHLALTALGHQRVTGFDVVVVCDAMPAGWDAPPFPLTAVPFAARNISAARNLGIAAARGEVLAFCDDDAVPEYDWLAELLAPFQNPKVGAATGYVRGRDGVGFQWRTVLFNRAGSDVLTANRFETEIYPPSTETMVKTVGCNAAFRRVALASVGGFDAAFRFFLDETDLNVRLNRAGWMTAVVPSAEVHHAFSPSPNRTSRRIPRSLYEIGASKAYFCAKYLERGEAEAAVALFRAEQGQRLARLVHFGLVSPQDRERLWDELDRGLADGRGRRPVLAEIDPPAGPAPAIEPRSAPRVALLARRNRRAAAHAYAARHAAGGAEVTVLLPAPPLTRPSARFDADGFWLHRVPSLSLGGPWTATRELRRLAVRRGPFSVETA